MMICKDDLKISFARQLKRAMRTEEIDAATLAMKCDVGQKTILNYLDPENPNLPTLYTLYKLCIILNTPADYFIFGGVYYG